MERISFNVEKIPGPLEVILFSIKGELDHYTFPKIKSAINLLIESKIKALVINLQGLEYLDSTSISFFCGLQRSLKYKIHLWYAAPSPSLSKYLTISHADKVMSLAPSVHTAIKKLLESAGIPETPAT